MEIMNVHVSQRQTKDCHCKEQLDQERSGVITDLDHLLEALLG